MTSLGAKSLVVEKTSDLDAVADAIANRRPGQPLFIEAKLDPDMVSAITDH